MSGLKSELLELLGIAAVLFLVMHAIILWLERKD